MDCKKLNEIFKRSCNHRNAEHLRKSNIFNSQLTYYENDIQTKADANCINIIKLITKLNCNTL